MPTRIIAALPAPQPAPVVPLLHHAGATDICGTFYPEDEGAPPVLSIGSRVSGERIERIAARHGLNAAALLSFARGN